MTIGLVSCGKKKLDHRAPARDLYVSPLFRKALAYCLAHYDRVYILSAKYGLLNLDEPVRPYDDTLSQMTRGQRERWSWLVFIQLWHELKGKGPVSFFFHAGELYSEGLIRKIGFNCHRPLMGLRFGKRLLWYDREASR
jgi:hypothetical protein